MAPEHINIFTVTSDVGSLYAGKSRAPAAFARAGLQDKLGSAGFTVTESPGVPERPRTWVATTREPNGGRNEVAVVEVCHEVKQAVADALAKDDKEKTPTFQLMLSGECMFCPPILSAYWHHLQGTDKRIGMVYMDADVDLATPADPAANGNIAGMTVTHMTLRPGALESMKPFSRPSGAGVIDASNMVFFGTNMESPTNKPRHLGYLFDNAFRVVTATAVQSAPAESAGAALRWLEDRVDYIIVHLDIDMIDPGLFPLCNVPNYTGIGFPESMAAVHTFLKSEKVVGLSVAEVNPDHDPGLEMTGRLVDQLVSGLKARKDG